jgi:hypothetical protein
MDLKEHLMVSAERELGAYLSAVSVLFGAEHARRAADDWLDEFERMDALPETRRDFGAITIRAAVRRACSAMNDYDVIVIHHVPNVNY